MCRVHSAGDEGCAGGGPSCGAVAAAATAAVAVASAVALAGAGGAAVPEPPRDGARHGGGGVNGGAGGMHVPVVGCGADDPMDGAGGRGASPAGGGAGGASPAGDGEEAGVPPQLDVDVAILRGHKAEVFICAWSPTEDLLASGCALVCVCVCVLQKAGGVTRGHCARTQLRRRDCADLEPDKARRLCECTAGLGARPARASGLA